MSRVIHYAGALSWRSAAERMTSVTAGFAACCSGERAERIARDEAHTYDLTAVTCGACKRAMQRAGVLPKEAP